MKFPTPEPRGTHSRPSRISLYVVDSTLNECFSDFHSERRRNQDHDENENKHTTKKKTKQRNNCLVLSSGFDTLGLERGQTH